MGEKVAIWTQLTGIPLKQYYVDVEGIRTRVLEAGEGEHTLIFVHGNGGTLGSLLSEFCWVG